MSSLLAIFSLPKDKLNMEMKLTFGTSLLQLEGGGFYGLGFGV
jgi:hypothetical protein